MATAPDKRVRDSFLYEAIYEMGAALPVLHVAHAHDIETAVPHLPQLTCAAGHQCAEELTEYVDGEVISQCENCGERIILPRVPGRIPYLRLQAFVGVLTGLELGVDEGIDLSEILGMFGDIKEALDAEEAAVESARELFDVAEAILRRKLGEVG